MHGRAALVELVDTADDGAADRHPEARAEGLHDAPGHEVRAGAGIADAEGANAEKRERGKEDRTTAVYDDEIETVFG